MPQKLFKNSILKFIFPAILAFVFSLLNINQANAANLLISPASSKITAGNIITVKVLVNTDGKSVNTVDSVIQYPIDLLEAMSISKSNSIFTMWVEEPKFSNYTGQISFVGGVPNGFNSPSGQIISITFKAKKTGNTSIVFTDSSVRQNDGLGTDILNLKQSATVEIKASEQVLDAPVVNNIGTPDAPVVTSITHSNQNKWYNTNNVELNWNVPNDIIAVSTSIGHSPVSLPTVVYDPPIGNKKIQKLEDGIWYFNIRFKNKNGWGAINHFKIQIDTVPPNPFKITFPHGDKTEDPRPVVLFNTTDDLSGIEHYEVKIGESEFNIIAMNNVSSNPYTPEVQDPGKHSILVKAIDYAGNETVQSNEFTVLAINSPVIIDYPTELSEGDLLRIRGTSYPLTNVEIIVEDQAEHKTSEIANVTIDGSFTITWPKNLNTGSYTFIARAIDKRDAKSEFTKPLSFVVHRSAFINITNSIFNWLSLIIIILVLLGGIAYLINHFVCKVLKLKRFIKHEVNIAESSVHKAFDLLRENVREQIQTLEKTKSKRELTKEEEKIIKKLQENLTKSEEYLEEEILNIEKGIK